VTPANSGRCADVVRVLATTRSIRDPDTGECRDSLSRDWSRYLAGLGVTTVPLVNEGPDPAGALESLSPDAVLLTNGEDVGAHEPRDRTETTLVDTATARGLPVLGICRGHQFINDYYGGTLTPVDSANGIDTPHAGADHAVTIRESPVRPPLPPQLRVNSFHDWGIAPDDVAAPLEPFADSEDGKVVEGLYHPDRPILSIQWHPERPLPDRNPVDDLVTGFLKGDLTW
jgi:putative glutamine amidotransferase